MSNPVLPYWRKRVKQPVGTVSIDRGNFFGARVIDALYGTSAKTVVQGKDVTKYGTLSAGTYPGGYGYKASGAGGIGFPCNLSGNSELTFVFEYTQHSRSGSQVLFEHSVNQNVNAGSFICYTDVTTGRLYYGTSTGSGQYDSGYCSLPPLGEKTTLALRLRFTAGSGTADIGIAVNGVLQATTTPNISSAVLNFGSFQTYLLCRAGTSLYANATFGGYAVLKGFATDAGLASLSANPWQIFAPIRRHLFVPATSGALNAAADGAAQASGSANIAAQVALAAVGVSVAGGSAGASVAVPLSAVGFAVSGGTANAVATVTISAAGLAQAVGSANLSGGAAGALDAAGQAQASGSAALNVTVTLNATGGSQASGSANLSGGAPGQIAAVGGAQSGGSAQVVAMVAISAAGYAQAMASGQLSIQIPLTAFGGAISAGSGVLTLVPDVVIEGVSEMLRVPGRRSLLVAPGRRFDLRV